MSVNYRILVNGVKAGLDHKQVTANLSVLFKTPEDQVKKILAENGYPVKKGVDLQTAAKYQAAIDAAGAVVIVEPEKSIAADQNENRVVEAPNKNRESVVATKKCSKCSFELPETAKFCTLCGSSFSPELPTDVKAETPKNIIDNANGITNNIVAKTAENKEIKNIIIVLLAVILAIPVFIFASSKIFTSDFSFGASVTPKTLFHDFATSPGNSDLYGNAVYESGSFIKKGYVGVAGSEAGEAEAYMAKVRYKLDDTIDEIVVMEIIEKNGRKKIMWRGEVAMQPLLDLLEMLHYHDR